VLDAEGGVAGIGGVMTVGTDAVGARELDRTYHGEDGFGAEILVTRGLSTGAGEISLLGRVLLERVGEG